MMKVETKSHNGIPDCCRVGESDTKARAMREEGDHAVIGRNRN